MSEPLTTLIREPAQPGARTLVLLHGRATDESDLFGLFDILDPDRRFRGIAVGGPLRLPPGGKHWYEILQVGFPDPVTFGPTYAELGRLLDEELALDWSQTVVGGFSQGTVMSYSLGLGAGRPIPAGILAMSGFIPTVDVWSADLGARRDLPVFIAHGSLDPIISVDFARAARDTLGDAGLAVEYHESASAHHIDPRVLPDIQRWLRDR